MRRSPTSACPRPKPRPRLPSNPEGRATGLRDRHDNAAPRPNTTPRHHRARRQSAGFKLARSQRPTGLVRARRNMESGIHPDPNPLARLKPRPERSTPVLAKTLGTPCRSPRPHPPDARGLGAAGTGRPLIRYQEGRGTDGLNVAEKAHGRRIIASDQRERSDGFRPYRASVS
jgi:hypothetical protein